MKNKTTAILLALFLGGLGIHKFYLGKNLQGILYLLFSFTLIPMAISVLEAICYMSYSADQWEKHTQNVDFKSKKCYECAELIRAEASTCRYCGTRLKSATA